MTERAKNEIADQEQIMLFYLAKLLSNEAKNWPKGPNRTVYEKKMIVFYWAKLLCNKAKNWQKGPKRRWLIKKCPWEDDSLYLMKPKMISSEVLPIHPHLLLYLLAFKTTTLWCFWYWLFHASVAVSQYLILPCLAQCNILPFFWQ